MITSAVRGFDDKAYECETHFVLSSCGKTFFLTFTTRSSLLNLCKSLENCDWIYYVNLATG